MSTDEIAAQLHKSAGAVRALQMRALQALARQMEQDEVYTL
jgi:DNA-directed RNA polymerase specialized sigma24 family protein